MTTKGVAVQGLLVVIMAFATLIHSYPHNVDEAIQANEGALTTSNEYHPYKSPEASSNLYEIPEANIAGGQLMKQ